jgi:hypothetical protein
VKKPQRHPPMKKYGRKYVDKEPIIVNHHHIVGNIVVIDVKDRGRL